MTPILPPPRRPSWLDRHPEVAGLAGKRPRPPGGAYRPRPCHCGMLTHCHEGALWRGPTLCCSARCYEGGPWVMEEPKTVERGPWVLLCLLVLLLASLKEMGSWLGGVPW